MHFSADVNPENVTKNISGFPPHDATKTINWAAKKGKQNNLCFLQLLPFYNNSNRYMYMADDSGVPDQQFIESKRRQLESGIVRRVGGSMLREGQQRYSN